MKAVGRKNEEVEVTSHSCTVDAETSRSTCRVEVKIVSRSPTAVEVGTHQEGRETRDLAEGHYYAVAAAAKKGHCSLH